MAHTDIHQEVHGLAASGPRLLYGLNDKPPFKDALFVGLQHVCAIFIPVCTPGLLITGALGYYIAAILVFLGLFPLVGGVLLAIPTPVFGGAVMVMFGTVAVAGFNILHAVNLDNRAFVILAVSLAAGLGVTFLPEALHQFPPAVQSVLESGIATGSICALVLNLVVPRPKEEALAAQEEQIAAESTVPMEPK